MSSSKAEQARRIPFESSKTNDTPHISNPSPESRLALKEGRRIAKEVKQQTSDQSRTGIPLLNVSTTFSQIKQSLPYQREISIQERRKQKHKSSHPVKDVDPISALSQSDGTLIIGFLQNEFFGKHSAGLSISKSPAPEIVITPAANLENPWISRRRRQPRSSVYSQATRISQVGATIDINAPPVPSLPSQALFQNRPRPTSVASWHTDFSYDGARDEVCRRYSDQTQLEMTRNMSINTTRERSEGWWNTIISPIFGRGDTICSKRGHPMPTQNTKSQPEFVKGARIEEEGNRNSRSSIWTDLSQLDAQRQTLGLFHDSPTKTRSELPSGNGNNLSPELVQEQGFGLGSEYYEATWHDAYSSTPFYKCQNHDCAQKIAYRHGTTIGGPDGLVESVGLTEEILTALMQDSKGFPISIQGSTISQTPKAMEPTASNLAHIRNNSDGTDIDEEPDVFSGLHESHSNSSSKAASPMPELRHHDVDHAREFSPKQAIAVTVQRPKKPAFKVPAKGLGVMESERELRTSEPGLSSSSESFERLKENHSSSQKGTKISHTAVPITTLEDPFQDVAYCTSPKALSPTLRKAFHQRNAIRLDPIRKLSPSNSKITSELLTHHDPLNIDLPRKAPLPPQSNASSTQFPINPLGANPATMVPMYGLPGSRPIYHESTSTIQSFSDKDKAFTAQGGLFRDVKLDFAPPPSSIAPRQKNIKSEEEKSKNQGCFTLGCLKRKQDRPVQRRKRWYCLIAGSLIALIILIVVLILTFTLHRSDAAVQTSFLNITGFPPIPTGIATIAQPNAAIEDPRCVAPNTLWSCAVPKEQQPSITPNAPDQPNFRVEIRFQNDSSILNSTNIVKGRSVSNAVGASYFVRSQIIQAKDAFTSSLFSPSPAPPNREEQIFLGNTTDNNTAPFQGEATPFFISFLPTTAINSKRALFLRDNGDPFPNITSKIPPPSSNSDGTAASANLVPFPTAQPLMLYNRGRSDEHYGFYTFFDRSIFLKARDLLNSTGPDIPDNADGGSTKSAANVRCTWAQTRFLVQIWTNAGNALKLMKYANASATSSISSATNFVQPGSFPYPISITLDRHGGAINEKMIYCYGMDETSRIISTAKQIHLENRKIGGQGLVNPGGALFGGSVNISLADGGPGGIDGGFGGCRCQWRNWV